MSGLGITLEFSGGAELLFDNIKKHQICLPGDSEWTIKRLLPWIREHLLRERPELFLQGDSVRPGILVLVNDADWELCGELEYKLAEGDTIVFISTLHGGKAVYVTKRRDITLICEWAECEKVYSQMDEFLTHLTDHLHAFVPQVIQPIDESTCVDDFVCEWRDCNYEMSGGFLELMRHVYFHGFHIKLKSIGLTMTLKKRLRGCTMDAGSRNVIPDLPERFHCSWKHCECVSDNAEYFYQHVKLHAQDYPQGRNLEAGAKCMWEGCEAVFGSRYKLMDHLRSHTQEKTVACPTCGSLFCSTTKFTDHLRRQDDLQVQSFQCSHCSKRFSSERLLRDHMRKHVNNFKCPFCEMTTPSPSTLRQHIRYRHSDERDFHCPHCDASFKMNRDLERHIKMRHEKVADYFCEHDGCSYKTRYEFQINEHMRNKHNLKDPKYVCQVCQRGYAKGRSLTQHLMKLHSFKWPPGHRRFRYKLGDDGNFHLQTVRYESYELSQQLQSERQRKALVGISVDGARGAAKKLHRPSKSQSLSFATMSTPSELDVVRRREETTMSSPHALDLSGRKGHGDTDRANIENREENTTSQTGTSKAKRKTSQGGGKQRKKKRKRGPSRDTEKETQLVGEVSMTEESVAVVGGGPVGTTECRVDLNTDSGPHFIPAARSELAHTQALSEESSVTSTGPLVQESRPVEAASDNEVDQLIPETLQIITEEGEVLLIQTNVVSGDQSVPERRQPVGMVTAANTPQGVLLSIQPQASDGGMWEEGGRIVGEIAERVSVQGEGFPNRKQIEATETWDIKRERAGFVEKKAGLVEKKAGLIGEDTGSESMANLGREEDGSGENELQERTQKEKKAALKGKRAGLKGKKAGLKGKKARLVREIQEDDFSEETELDGEKTDFDKKAELTEKGVEYYDKKVELALTQQAPPPSEEPSNVSHGWFYAVMNAALQNKSSGELILNSGSGDIVAGEADCRPREDGYSDEGQGGVMYNVQVPLGSEAVTIDLPPLAGGTHHTE